MQIAFLVYVKTLRVMALAAVDDDRAGLPQSVKISMLLRRGFVIVKLGVLNPDDYHEAFGFQLLNQRDDQLKPGAAFRTTACRTRPLVRGPIVAKPVAANKGDRSTSLGVKSAW